VSRVRKEKAPFPFIVVSQADLAGLYLKAGLRNMGTVLLITDAQIADEKFLVLINDLLASGEIADLFPDDEVDNIVSQLRNEVMRLAAAKITVYINKLISALIRLGEILVDCM
jgi:hypothetical protein